MKFFKPEDFGDPTGTNIKCALFPAEAADFANDKLKNESREVYAQWKSEGWTVLGEYWHPLEGKPGDTHKALLINIEPIEKCTHPKEKIKRVDYYADIGLVVDRKDTYRYGFEFKCECCAKVQPTSFEEIK